MSSLKNVEDVSKQVDYVIVCDNNKHSTVDFDETANIIHIKNHSNLGLSAAFNIALNLKEVEWSDDDFVIFFDQDSHISDGHILSLIAELEKAEQTSARVGCIGPVYYNQTSDSLCVPKMKTQIADGIYSVSSIITSSMLCRYGTLKKIGFWNEKLFLDLADWDVCWRMQQAGYLTCLTENLTLIHSLGEGQKKIGPIKLKIGSPIREYYQTRDCLVLLHEKYTPFKYKLRFIAMLTVRPILHLMFLNDKKKRGHYIYRGCRDYLSGITGEFEEGAK